MTEKVVVNIAHPAGRTFVAVSRDGRYEANFLQLSVSNHLSSVLYTGGCDSLVRVWKADSDTHQEPDTALDSDEAITALGVDVCCISPFMHAFANVLSE